MRSLEVERNGSRYTGGLKEGIHLLIASKKVSNLLAEFREQDSMVNSDWDDSEDDQPGPSTRPEKRPLTNTLLDMVDELLRFADCTDRPPGSAPPKLTLRVTRIVPECDIDPRVQETFNVIRSKGVRIEFGDLAEIPLLQLPVVLPEHQLRPSRRICLDPTALMALCSDLLHYPLPATRAEALRRFFRPSEKLQDKPGGRDATGPGREGEEAEKEEWRGQSQNSRELVKNVLEEMDIALIEEIRDLLTRTYGGGASIEWWTTREAVVYLTEALGSEEVVGDGMEQKRMRRLIGLEEGDFFEGSRYEGQAGVLSPLRLRIFDQDALDPVDPPTSFHRSLASVAQSCIDDYATYTRSPSKKTLEALPNFLKPQRIPVPKVAQLSSPFPIVSLQTLARGAKEGMTTLMMGNVVLRDLFGQPRWKVHGWTQASYEMEMPKMSEGEPIDAAVWMLPYRSLGEGKRVKFKRGDYSYPHHR